MEALLGLYLFDSGLFTSACVNACSLDRKSLYMFCLKIKDLSVWKLYGEITFDEFCL